VTPRACAFDTIQPIVMSHSRVPASTPPACAVPPPTSPWQPENQICSTVWPAAGAEVHSVPETAPSFRPRPALVSILDVRMQTRVEKPIVFSSPRRRSLEFPVSPPCPTPPPSESLPLQGRTQSTGEDRSPVYRIAVGRERLRHAAVAESSSRQPAIRDHSRQAPGGIGSSTEPEQEYLVARFIDMGYLV